MTTEFFDNPFERVNVFLGVSGGAEVSFKCRPVLNYPEPYTFRVDHAITPAAPWTSVGTPDGNWVLVDHERYKYDVLAESWYRVVLVDVNGAEYKSGPVQPGSFTDRHDFLVARDACRRAYQKMRLCSGSAGWLMKRKEWGPLCTACLDPVSNQPTNSQCPVCFGVGVVGGYYDACDFMLELDNGPYQRVYGGEQASHGVQSKRARSVNFPRVLPDDIWIDAASNRRWRVQPGIEVTASLRGVDLLIAFVLQPIETTDVVYDFPRPDGSSISG